MNDINEKKNTSIIVEGYFLHLIRPLHGECGFNHFALGRQVEPNLKQLEGVGLVGVHQRKHLTMNDAFASSHPLRSKQEKEFNTRERIEKKYQTPLKLWK